MPEFEVPVLVVGAGPVGLTASLLLSAQGIDNLVVDQRRGPHRAPQAHVVNPRSLEIFRQLGIDTARLRALATPRRDGGHVSWVTSLAGTELGRLPYERQDDGALALTPEPIINLPQHVLEPILLEHVEEAAHARVAWHCEWQGLAEDAGGVTCRVRDTERDEEHEVRSRWVLAADGAGSRIRKGCGIAMIGPERIQSFVTIHFEAGLRELVRERPAIIYWTVDPEAMGSFIAHDIDRTWVFMHPHDPEADPFESYDEPRCAAIVRRAIGRDDVELAVRTVGQWHMTSQVAARYRAGRVFLVGDSAHRFPPAGGMGMNTGIQDAHNLAWKLRLVEESRARTELLDTYQAERRPIAQQNADQSLDNAVKMLEMMAELGLGQEPAVARSHLAALLSSDEGRARIRHAIQAQRNHFDMLGLQLGFCYEAGAILTDGTAAPKPANPVSDVVQTGRPGARAPHAWIEVDGVWCSSLDLLRGDTFTLLTGPDGWRWVAAADMTNATDAMAKAPVRTIVVGKDCVDPAGAWLHSCGIEADGALLVRPDQHVAWRSPRGVTDAREALASALAALL